MHSKHVGRRVAVAVGVTIMGFGPVVVTGVVPAMTHAVAGGTTQNSQGQNNNSQGHNSQGSNSQGQNQH